MTKLTFNQAKNISIAVWEFVVKHNFKPEGKSLYQIVKKVAPRFDGLNHKKKYVDLAFGCGFCDKYELICRECPLFWEDAHEEEDSLFDRDASLHCSRNFWKWNYYSDREDYDKAKEYAEKMLEEIKNV